MQRSGCFRWHGSRRAAIAVVAAGALTIATVAQHADTRQPDDLLRAVVAAHADFAHRVYAASHDRAAAMRDAIAAFLEAPSAASLEAARAAWIAARDVYGTTEVLRFQSGPIDDRQRGVETWLNAWPVDEAYIDRVAGGSGRGIIQDVERFPNLSPTLLVTANERGGEANVSIGWHAIEFLLWGQDLHRDGPGRRPHTEYLPGADPDAARRRDYLRIVTDLLLEHLAQVRDAWRPDADDFRRRWDALEPREALRRMLTGMVVLTGFELAGERLAVAYETRDQEDEHSCFSDTTHRDLLANQRGIAAVWHGAGDGAAGLGAFVRTVAPELAADVDRRIATALDALAAIPAPFDAAVLGDDDAPGRSAVLAAILALEAQAEALATLGLELGLKIPLRPGG